MITDHTHKSKFPGVWEAILLQYPRLPYNQANMRSTILELSPNPLSLPSYITESSSNFHSKHFPVYIQNWLEKTWLGRAWVPYWAYNCVALHNLSVSMEWGWGDTSLSTKVTGLDSISQTVFCKAQVGIPQRKGLYG